MPVTFTKKLWAVALYSSPVIAALAVTPLFIVNRYTTPQYIISVLLMTGLVLYMWGINILLYYILTRQKKAGKPARYIYSYLLAVICSVLVVTWIFEMHLQDGHDKHHAVFHYHLVVFLSMNTAVLILQDLVLVRKQNTDMERENLHLRMKNIEAANLQLKQQVQPHFLFNSLSTLKALIKTNTVKAEEYLVKLSDFLRYAVSSGSVHLVTVQEEVQLCMDYLQMQQIRFGDALQVAINTPGVVVQQGQLPVFSLQVLAENAIKHNMLTTASPLVISIYYDDGRITVTNNMQPLQPQQPASGGIGLANLAERYKMLCGDDIIVTKTNKTFSVSIKVI